MTARDATPQYRVVQPMDGDTLRVRARADLYPAAIASLQELRRAEPDSKFYLIVIMRA